MACAPRVDLVVYSRDEEMTRGFQCASCGKWHDELPLDFAFDEPKYVAELDDEERAKCVKGAGDFRELLQEGEKHYFIRGVLEIPIVGTDDVFCYGVWTSLSAQSHQAANEAYRKKIDAGPFFGWLSNVLPNYPNTLNLKTHV